MKTTNVAIVNGITLQVVADDREQLVAVKPVCEILGVDAKSQREKIEEHPLFSSVRVLSPSTGTITLSMIVNKFNHGAKPHSFGLSVIPLRGTTGVVKPRLRVNSTIGLITTVGSDEKESRS